MENDVVRPYRDEIARLRTMLRVEREQARAHIEELETVVSDLRTAMRVDASEDFCPWRHCGHGFELTDDDDPPTVPAPGEE